MAWLFVTTDGTARTVKMARIREDLARTGGSISDEDVIKTFTRTEWEAIIALDDTATGAQVRVAETLPFPKTGER